MELRSEGISDIEGITLSSLILGTFLYSLESTVSADRPE